METANIVLFIHGVVTETIAEDHTAQYEAMYDALLEKMPVLAGRIDTMIPIEWGHEPPAPHANLSLDQKLTRAENFIFNAISYDVLKSKPRKYERYLEESEDNMLRRLTRSYVEPAKDKIAMLGIGDAFFYTSPDGEQAVRRSVYSQALNGLRPFKAKKKVLLHVIGHSQGATIGFDFLYGLFAPDSAWEGGVPHFAADEEVARNIRDEYLFWRKKATDGELLLGSKSSFGCQVALMMLRKGHLVEMLAREELLDPMVIGVPAAGKAKWKIFYDTNDPLGFPAKRLFKSDGSIWEYEVNSSIDPVKAHSMYWFRDEVQEEIAKLIADNSDL